MQCWSESHATLVDGWLPVATVSRHTPSPTPLPFLLRPLEPKPGQVDFLAETDHFIHALKEGLKSLVGGLELRGMDSETRESSEGLDTRNFTQVCELCVCFEVVRGRWVRIWISGHTVGFLLGLFSVNCN